MRIVLAGSSVEAFTLSRRLGFEPVAIVDPNISRFPYADVPVLSSDREALQFENVEGVLIGIDSPSLRNRVHDFYSTQGVSIVDAIDGDVDDFTTYGSGLFVQRSAAVSAGCKLGVGVRLNTGALIMHDAAIGDFTTFAPRSVILGHVTVGKRCYIGANATILPNVKIGDDVVIGAGSVVTRDVSDRSIVKGVPAR